MEKIIKKTISLTTKKRDNRNKLFEEFYSHDKNTATFEFTVEGGVPTEEIVVLFHFKRTNRHLEVRGRVDNDKIIVNFDTSLIIKDEQVAGYIYYENGDKSNDVYRFMFDVHVSEIDKEHDLPIMEQESKRIVPLTDIVTKSEITELLKKIVANEKLYDDTAIKQQIESKADKETVQAISSKVEALETNSGNRTTYDDAEIRGQIATKADTQSVEAIAQRVQTLENKTDNDTVYNDTELRQAIEEKVDKQALLQYLPKSELTPINEKVQSIETNIGRMVTQQQLESYVSKNELEQKGYLTSADTRNFALKSEIPPQFDGSALTERINALENKAISNGAYNDKPLLDKIHEVEESLKGFITQSSRYLVEHQSLAHLVTKDELASKGYITNHQSLENLVTKEELENKGYLKAHQSLENLVTKDELATKGYLTTHQDISGLVTKQELEDKHYLTNHQDISNLATNAKVEAVESRVQTLENKPPVDVSNLATKQELEYVRNNQQTVDTSNLVTKQELENKHYIQEHQSLANLVTKDELESKGFLNAHQSLEEYAKKTEIPKIDISSFVTKEELEAKQYLKDHQSLDGYVKKSELPPQVDTSTFVSKQELTNMHLVNAEELGNVSKKMFEQTTKITALESKAEYEIHGTGMPNGTVSAPIGTTYVDTAVTNGALKWIKESGDGDRGWKILIGDTGWRNIDILSKLGDSTLHIRRVNNQVTYKFGGLQWGWFGIIRRGGAGYTEQETDRERNCYLLGRQGVPLGFRTPNSLIGPIYNDRGVPYGTWYIGNGADVHHLRFQFLNPVPTDSDIGDIRVSTISYYTDDEWPTVLP